MGFLEKLNGAVKRNQSLVCVGLDPDPQHLPAHLKGGADSVQAFLRETIHATRDLVCCYKLNFAFYGALGAAGWNTLREGMQAIPDDLPTILDFKAGDIGNTAEHYARMAYDRLNVDATTVNPLMGRDAVEPFLNYTDRCAFLLCLTSNPGSADFQRLATEEDVLYKVLAKKAVVWSAIGPCGLVVGATHPNELRVIRELAPDLPFLIPGVNTQGGDAKSVVQNGMGHSSGGILVNASRSILYASGGRDFADAARRATEALRKALNQAVESVSESRLRG